MCAEGIGYLGVAVVLGGMSAILLLAGLLTAVARPSIGRSGLGVATLVSAGMLAAAGVGRHRAR